MTENNVSSNGKLTYWILGATFALLMSILGYWINGLERRISILESDLKTHIAESRSGYERLSSTEQRVKYNEDRIVEILMELRNVGPNRKQR